MTTAVMLELDDKSSGAFPLRETLGCFLFWLRFDLHTHNEPNIKLLDLTREEYLREQCVAVVKIWHIRFSTTI